MIFQVLLWSVKNWISLKSRQNFGRKFYWISILHSLGCHSYRFSVNMKPKIKVLTFLHSLTTSNSPGANKGGKHKHLSPPSPLQLPPSGPSVRLHYPLQGHAVHYNLHYWHQCLDTEVWCIDEDYLHKRGDILITGLPLAKQFTHSPQRARNSVWPSPSYCSSETQVQIY